MSKIVYMTRTVYLLTSTVFIGDTYELGYEARMARNMMSYHTDMNCEYCGDIQQ